jgi:hypothetical protein
MNKQNKAKKYLAAVGRKIVFFWRKVKLQGSISSTFYAQLLHW